jgi:ABC-type dipeptide/oligopeptide/nickel transport system permease subunit
VANIAPSLAPLDIDRAPEGGEIGAVHSGWRLAFREFAQNKLALIGIGILLFFVIFCFLGPLFYHGNTVVSDLSHVDAPPQAGLPLGADDQGFDELALLMKGGQVALEVGFAAAAIGITIGMLWGSIAGLAGGIIDSAMMRVVDVFLSIPFLFIVLIVSIRYGASVLGLAVIIGVFTWLVPARLVRGEVLTLRTRDFVAAARTAGAKRWRLINRHLIPNALGVIIVNVTFNVADAILAVAALGFLGFGLHYPNQDWGDMLGKGVAYMQSGYWWLVFPVGASIVLVVMACNLIGDALRDSLDVRLRRR